MPKPEAGELKAIYEEICRAHDGIADFRAKLLALLPIASGAGIFLLVRGEVGSPAEASHLLPLGIFGALVTLGLFLYELRGIQKCHGLIACAQRLERKLTPEDWAFGGFNFRQEGAFHGLIGTTGAALVIYPTVTGAWLYVAALGLSRSVEMEEWALGGAIAAGLGIVMLGRHIVAQQKALLRRKLNALEGSSGTPRRDSPAGRGGVASE